jgi:hypothetical protein
VSYADSAVITHRSLVRVEPTTPIDSNLAILLELAEFVVDPVIGKVQFFAQVFDHFRVFQRHEQRVLETVRDEPVRDGWDVIVPLFENIQGIEHGKRNESACGFLSSLDILEDAFAVEVSLLGDQPMSSRSPSRSVISSNTKMLDDWNK